MKNQIVLPHAGIVLMIGSSNSGKTTLLNKLVEEKILKKSEVISSDQFRLLVSDTDYIEWSGKPKDEADVLSYEYQLISNIAFETMDYMLEARCKLGKLTVIDATHLHSDDRQKYVDIARKHHVPAIAISLDIPEDILIERDANRDFPRGKKRIKQQYRIFKQNIRFLKKEGFKASFIIDYRDLENTTFILRNNPLDLDIGNGIDIIGDIHGCFDELIELLDKLGYRENEEGLYIHPNDRKFVLIGDVMSRGPKSLDTLIFVKKHIRAGLAYMIDSNHGWKIARWLDGKDVKLGHGDEKFAEEFEQYSSRYGEDEANELKKDLKELLLAVPSHYVFHKNGVPVLVTTHAGIKDHYIGKQSQRISDFCRYGDTDGVDERGKPIRKDWFINHKSQELIVWGHDPKPTPLIINNTVNIDQGAVFGGNLTAYSFPERKFISVKAKKDYSGMDDNPLKVWREKRFNPPNITRFIEGYQVLTTDYGEVEIFSELAKPAVDAVSHFTVPIEELVYIPPTMSPAPKTSELDDYLEHPIEAFQYYKSNGINKLIVEKKHMGSRAVLLLFKDKHIAKNYIDQEKLGTIYTRTGRAFFTKDIESEILNKLNHDLNSYGYFDKYNTDFVLLDAEILPWNLKAKELINSQYSHVAEVAMMDRRKLKENLEKAYRNGKDVDTWIAENEIKLHNAKIFNEVFQFYCWDTEGISGIQIAPFHILAHSTDTFFNMTHEWHMQMNREFANISDLFIATEYRVVTDEKSEQEAIKWWEDITQTGHEGFVVKPEKFIDRDEKGRLLQPAIKVRGRKYLHIIYGMDYLLPENLDRLKMRNVGKKQRNALKEFALGLEGIRRFVSKESIDRVHECVLGTLALEEEPIDPRL